MKTPIAIFISGEGTNMAALLYASRADDCPYEVVLVASNNPQAPGLTLAKAEGHRHLRPPPTPASTALPHDAIMERAALGVGAQYIALAGYMRLLSPEFAERWAGRMLNIHPSLLPKYKGLNTYARALEAGDAQAGCSVHLVTAEVDDGDVLGQSAVAVLPGDTVESLGGAGAHCRASALSAHPEQLGAARKYARILAKPACAKSR